MRTLIELYDRRPFENVLSTDVFKPEFTVYICSEELYRNKKAKARLEKYFRHRGLDTRCIFFPAKFYSAASILESLRQAADECPDCALDITGGTDDALFAAGLLCAEKDIPVFTFSRRRNRFFSISNAPFAEGLECTVEYDVEDFFLMAGGSMRQGRVDNSILQDYFDIIDPFFRLYLAWRRRWGSIVNYIQRVSQAEKGTVPPLAVHGDYEVKGERGRRIKAPEGALREMEDIGLIENLRINRPKSVEFSFKDSQVRTWLRDVGSVLEIYTYKACVDSGLFNSVRTSVVVDWEADHRRDGVTNEIDVMAVRGTTPYFISCKTCDVKTEALNELAILRGRFGGQAAKAAIVTAEYSTDVMRNRASELGIDVIDLDDLRRGNLRRRLRALVKSDK
ncbi:MAG: Card1-like endonuclease domain-containing protein [Candidatus Limivicinus sp.]|jgi:hypothetical protein